MQPRTRREKIGLISIILALMVGVGFLTFGFTLALYGNPPNRYHSGEIQAASIVSITTSPTLITLPSDRGWNSAGNDISFLFQNINQQCRDFITKAANPAITGSRGNLNWYFPRNIYNQRDNSGVSLTGVETNCHYASRSRTMLAVMKPEGQVYCTWDDVHDPSGNLAAFES